MKSFLRLAASLLVALPALAPAQVPDQPSSNNLTIDFIDVEGGQATLFITPSHQSLLVDAGWSGHGTRDADRIVAAAHKHGLARIDFVLITHFHTDHVGGVAPLLSRIPVGTFLDHGPNRETDNPEVVANFAAYEQALAQSKAQHLTLKPGDHLPIPGLDATVISADGNLIASPLPGTGGPNLFCGESENKPADTTENARSLGILIHFGRLRILDLGDLTWDKEMQLMCPVNKVGKIDILVVSHHGWYQSSSPSLVLGVEPRVAIMDNGATKGGSIPTFATFNVVPSLDALWQLHYSEEAGPALNRPAPFLANLQGTTDSGFGLELTASPDGSFAITNQRTSQTTTYASTAPPLTPTTR